MTRLKALVLLVMIVSLLSGCTLITAATGAITGIVDCTYWKVAHTGVAGLLWVPVAPFEGAYRGAQVGWMSDRALIQNKKGPLFLAHVLPCSVNELKKAWTGESLTWEERL